MKCSTLAKLLSATNFGESVYNWGGEEGKEELKASEMGSETESIYSQRTDMTRQTSITCNTEQLGITVRND